MTRGPSPDSPRLFHQTKLGEMYFGDSLRVLEDRVLPGSVDQIMASLLVGLVPKKDFSNLEAAPQAA